MVMLQCFLMRPDWLVLVDTEDPLWPAFCIQNEIRDNAMSDCVLVVVPDMDFPKSLPEFHSDFVFLLVLGISGLKKTLPPAMNIWRSNSGQ